MDDITIKQTRRKGDATNRERLRLIRHINLQLAALDQPAHDGMDDQQILEVAEDLLRNYRQQRRLLTNYQCPADHRIQTFLNAYFSDHGMDCPVTLPSQTFVLDKPHLAREMSIPPDEYYYNSKCIESYRVFQGVLHNPTNDRRTTKGVFHIVEGPLPIPGDKKAVPIAVYGKLLEQALNPPMDQLRLPFTSGQAEEARVWVSLLLRPKVSPAIEGQQQQRSMETRFFAPGGLVANLDFVERIFGNAGDPFLPENDAGLDIHHWTGTTGCIILAPHLVGMKKRDLGLPNVDEATPRQARDGMCWQDEEEAYNEGLPFKLVCRDMRGVIVTLIADNYFGYSKKEIKSQISYSTNLIGGCEEEHAGGALAFPSYNLGDNFYQDSRLSDRDQTFEEVTRLLEDVADLRKEGYAVDRHFPDVIYLPENVHIQLGEKRISWVKDGEKQQIKLLADHVYIHPSGYKIRMEKHPHAPTWRLVGTESEGTFCHKPCTVSGGGKSEISKSLSGSIISGPFFVGNITDDLDQVELIFQRDYSDRFRYPPEEADTRSLLSPKRTLGSVIKLLTPSISEYTDEYNEWLKSIPQHIRAIVFVIKRFYQQHWGDDWRSHFTVDIVNNHPGHELKFNRRIMVASYLRVGLHTNDEWRIFKLRQDFMAADKVQMEDDISVSTVVPTDRLNDLEPGYDYPGAKIVENCESMLFQRPDEAKNRGLDEQTEEDLAGTDNFISNFEPLTRNNALELIDDAMGLNEFTEPMQRLIREVAGRTDTEYFVSSAHPRVVDGKPSLNVRYLQKRPDLAKPRDRYVAEIGMRLSRRIPCSRPLHLPVNAVMPGRRNNPPDPAKGIRPLSVYNPIHYQELPELFMDFLCSLTGKSPSTTGAGSEGALTKGPFNALSETADLNTALVSYILTGYGGFSTAAGHIGKDRRVDHDVSLLIPEIWCRLPPGDRDPQTMLENGYLEKMEDFDFEGETVLASRLGYRITSRFVHAYFGRIFDAPTAVFDEAMLKPETQDPASFVDGVRNIIEAQQRVATRYLEDGSVKDACPPLRAMLHILADGEYNGLHAGDSEFREMFSREYLMESDWYQERLDIKQLRDIALWTRHVDYLTARMEQESGLDQANNMDLSTLITQAGEERKRISSPEYRAALQGTLGADWIHRKD